MKRYECISQRYHFLVSNNIIFCMLTLNTLTRNVSSWLWETVTLVPDSPPGAEDATVIRLAPWSFQSGGVGSGPPRNGAPLFTAVSCPRGPSLSSPNWLESIALWGLSKSPRIMRENLTRPPRDLEALPNPRETSLNVSAPTQHRSHI